MAPECTITDHLPLNHNHTAAPQLSFPAQVTLRHSSFIIDAVQKQQALPSVSNKQTIIQGAVAEC